MKLEAIVRTYIRRIRPRAQTELDWFVNQPSLRAAIKNATLVVNSRGKRYSDQRRLTRVALERALGVLSTQAGAMKQVRVFSDLFNRIDASLEPIPGLGELYVYDTSLRIGAKLNLFPKKVYPHAGTRLGTRALGLRRAAALKMSELPKELRALKPHEIEDLLCIFKGELKALRASCPPQDIVNKSSCG